MTDVLGKTVREPGRLLRRPTTRAAVGVVAVLSVVGGMTAAHAAGAYTIRMIAASPSAIADGRLWLLVTSGLVVQGPVTLSLLSFAGLAVLALAVCGPRCFWVAAAFGHVGSTLLAYVLIAALGQVDARAVAGVVHARDYGVSAIAAAWLGAVAVVAWDRRGGRLRDKAPVAVSCLAIALFAAMVRRHLTILDTEHVFAFAIGVRLAGSDVRTRARVLGRTRVFAMVVAVVAAGFFAAFAAGGQPRQTAGLHQSGDVS